MRGQAWRSSAAAFRALRAASALLGGPLLACTVLQDEASDAIETRSLCSSDSQCSTGYCQRAFGVCSQPRGALTRLLFEITPAAADPVYGGARFLTVQDLSAEDLAGVPERGIEPGWRELNVRPRVPVNGSVRAELVQAACPSRARSTLPMHLTFNPRERLFGLSESPYDVSTSFNEATGEFEFHGLLPPGRYDVYMRPDSSELGPECTAVPQIFRDRVVGDGLFELPQPPPSPLRLTVPWKAGLEGWTVDVVHPVTGEIISNRVRLGEAARDPEDPSKLEAQLIYSNTVSDFMLDGDANEGGAELIRFAPPGSSPAGTVLLQRTGIGLATPGEGQIGDVLALGTPVDYQAWVWKRDEFDTPVPGTVRFAARDLADAADGVPTAFDTTATVDELGRIQVRLLPGTYRVRVTPPGINVPNLGLLSSFEKTITVWPNESGNVLVQGGHVIEVPPAVTLVGRVQTDSGEPLEGVEIQASASNTSQELCPSPTGDEPAVFCDRTGVVLRTALAQDPFVPRTRSGLSEDDGEFSISGLDCGQCEPGAGARFDLSVRPPVETGLPWLLRRDYPLDSNQRMRVPLRVPRPVAHAIRLTYGDPTPGTLGGGSTVPGLAGALVRVYALLDAQAQLVTDAEALVPCVGVPVSQPCTQSAVQVAEVRSGRDGKLLLLLPPSL